MQQAIVHAYCVPPLNVTNPSSGKYAYVVRRIENKRSNIPQHTHTGDYCIRYCAYTTAAIYECIMLLIVLLPKLLCCPHVYIDVRIYRRTGNARTLKVSYYMTWHVPPDVTAGWELRWTRKHHIYSRLLTYALELLLLAHVCPRVCVPTPATGESTLW